MIEYRTSLDGIPPDDLEGFLVGWRNPLSCKQLYSLLQSSSYFALAYDTETNRVVGFVNALSDGINFAFIPTLEVLPAYQRRGIGSQLMKRILHSLNQISCIDLTCDPPVQSFYKRFGMLESHGMVIRRSSEPCHDEAGTPPNTA
jgi:ribosomal protein S18 acetylase RimI-like enzyme